jgi:hypothetical protein
MGMAAPYANVDTDSHCTWKDGELQATFRQPFDLIITSTKAYEHKKAAGVASNGLFENWRG